MIDGLSEYRRCKEHEEVALEVDVEVEPSFLMPSGFKPVTVVRRVGWKPARGPSVEECDGPDMLYV